MRRPRLIWLPPSRSSRWPAAGTPASARASSNLTSFPGSEGLRSEDRLLLRISSAKPSGLCSTPDTTRVLPRIPPSAIKAPERMGKKGRRPVNDPWKPDYIDEELAKAIGHPVRALILAEANDRVMSPSQFAKRHDLDLSAVSYHFRELEKKYGCLEEVATVPVRGANQ